MIAPAVADPAAVPEPAAVAESEGGEEQQSDNPQKGDEEDADHISVSSTSRSPDHSPETLRHPDASSALDYQAGSAWSFIETEEVVNRKRGHEDSESFRSCWGGPSVSGSSMSAS